MLTLPQNFKEFKSIHVFWTEAYNEREGIEMTFDTRFIHNIDSKFLTATLLDLDRSDDKYGMDGYNMLTEAVVVRLCRYDEHRDYWTSLLGPKVKVRRGVTANDSKQRYNNNIAVKIIKTLFNFNASRN